MTTDDSAVWTFLSGTLSTLWKHTGIHLRWSHGLRSFPGLRDSQVEPPELCTLKIPPLIMEVDGQIVDLMKKRELERPEKIELMGSEEKIELEGLEESIVLEGPKEMVKGIQQKGQEERIDLI
ncbi:hypothetical protein LWI28_021373 [Acer negundo]|uniref:Uncharacterized protein n=1 Tax=Acer negundo TaxID=4023 RepID=A0AAD5JB77_ACENE|nr:hypothetical protein LWI28_021373 [Acer negundo]